MLEITLEGPGRNALGTPVLTALRDRVRAAGDAPILLRGAGGTFSAGLNLKEVAALDVDGMTAFLGLLEETLSALYLHPGPVVGLVEGHAIAGGCVLALCCDWRIAGDDARARIGLNEVALGLRFPPQTWEIVRSRVPVFARERVFLGAGLHAPSEALALGLVDEVSADAEARARAVLAQLSAHPREGYTAAKRALREDVVNVSAERRAAFVSEVVPVWVSEPVKERLRAALKR